MNEGGKSWSWPVTMNTEIIFYFFIVRCRDNKLPLILKQFDQSVDKCIRVRDMFKDLWSNYTINRVFPQWNIKSIRDKSGMVFMCYFPYCLQWIVGRNIHGNHFFSQRISFFEAHPLPQPTSRITDISSVTSLSIDSWRRRISYFVIAGHSFPE